MPGKLNIYKASAGSGKTFTLTCDYISLLLAHKATSGYDQRANERNEAANGHDKTTNERNKAIDAANERNEAFKHILAVTFTNKATAEMKQRILQHLYGMAHGLKSSKRMFEKVCEKLPHVAPDVLRLRAGTALRSILHNYDRFSVTTIDSFFQTLLTNLAHELGLSANFRIDLGDREALHAAVERLVNRSATNTKEFKWLFDYIKSRIDDGERWDVTRETEDFARNLLRAEYLAKEEELSLKLGDDEFMNNYRRMLNEKTKEAEEALRSLAAALNEAINETICTSSHDDGRKSEFKNIKTLNTFVTSCLSGAGKEPSATACNMAIGHESWYTKEALKRGKDATEVKPLMDMLGKLIEQQKESACIINSCALSKKMLGPMRLLGHIDELLKEVNRENNRFLLASTPILFQKLVGSIDAPFVFEKAGIRYDHIMIDEFQDTSRLQWGNFKKLFIENLASGGDCMLVGDIKQSIYRWRGGDWNILGHIDKELKGLPLSISTLDHNYRSHAKIVNFNNGLFPELACKLGLDEIYCDVVQIVSDEKNKLDQGYVRVRIDKKTKGEKAENEETQETRMLNDMAEQIERLKALGVEYGDMAILVRTNREGARIINHFESNPLYAHIPLISEDAYLLSASPAVLMIIHAMKWLLNEEDSIALNYIAKHCAENMQHVAFEWGQTNEKLREMLPEAFCSECGRLKEMPLYELAELLIATFELNKEKGQHTYLFSFLDYLLKFLDDHSSSLEDFLNFWDESLSNKSVQAGGMNGIRILTIHKSKGLDFHTVLLPYHDWSIEPSNRQKPLIWCEPKSEGFDAMPLLPIKYEAKAEQSIYKDDYLAEQRQMRVENLNLIYVAFTRATSNLLIWSSYYKPAKGNSKINDIGALLYAGLANDAEETGDDENILLFREYGTPLPSEKEEEENSEAEDSQGAEEEAEVNPFDADEIMDSENVKLKAGGRGVEFVQSKASLQLREESEEDEEEENVFMKRGTLLHNILSQIERTDDFEAAFSWASAEGLFENKRSETEARRIIADALTQSIAREWYDGSWMVFNERTIDAGKLGTTYRPDRVLMKAGECIVIDYKFGRPLTKHKSQVAIYMSLLRQMGYSSVKGFIWYPMLKKIIEV